MTKDNNFDFLRQFAAFLVIVGHSESIIGTSHTGFWSVSISTLGIQIFFAVSGYLVTESWLRQPNFAIFLSKRAKRIFPALIGCVLISTFLLGLILTRLSISEYLANPNTFAYLKNIALYPVYNLPGVFEGNTYPNAVNGSLWSLPIEFACYIVLAVLGFLVVKVGKRISIATSTITLLGVASCMTLLSQLLTSSQPVVIWGSPLKEALEIAPFFIMGSCIKIALSSYLRRPEVIIVLVFVMVTAMSNFPQYFWALNWVVIPVLALSFGTSRLSILPRWGHWGDPSYGMYLYAFPVQQTFQYVTNNQIGLAGMILGTTLISLVLGYISWHLIEKRFLMRSRVSSLVPSHL